MLCGLFVALSVTVSVPVRVPVAVGVNVTLNVQLEFGITRAGKVPHLFVWAKSPLMATFEITSVVVPGFERVMVCGVLVLPMTWPANVKVDGEKLA